MWSPSGSSSSTKGSVTCSRNVRTNSAVRDCEVDESKREERESEREGEKEK